MPYSFHFDEPSGVLIEIVTGFVTDQDILESFEMKKNVTGYRPGIHMLCDYRDVKFEISDNGVRKLAEYVKDHEEYFGETKWAVVTSSPLALAFARIYCLLTRDSCVQTQAFSKIEEAKEWLGMGK